MFRLYIRRFLAFSIMRITDTIPNVHYENVRSQILTSISSATFTRSRIETRDTAMKCCSITLSSMQNERFPIWIEYECAFHWHFIEDKYGK